MITRVTSYGRAGLLGNPSDGYFGKTIALGLLDFPAQVTIFESPEIRIEHNREDISDPTVKDFQPMGSNMGILPPLETKERDKQKRYLLLAERAMAALESCLTEADEHEITF